MNPSDTTTGPIESTFTANGQTLFAATYQPADKPWARLLLLHGYGDHSGRYTHFFQWLTNRGIKCLTFDFRGQGRSSGRHGYVQRWTDYADDLDAFLNLEQLKRDADVPLFLLGHSHGGLIAAHAGITGRLSCLRGCILSAPYLGNGVIVPLPKRLLAYIGHIVAPALGVRSGLSGDMMTRDPEMSAQSENDPLLQHTGTPRWFVTMLAMQKIVQQNAASFTQPLLCLTGAADRVADNAVTARFYEQCNSSDKTARLYLDFRHELLRELNREIVFNDILLWMQKRA